MRTRISIQNYKIVVNSPLYIKVFYFVHSFCIGFLILDLYTCTRNRRVTTRRKSRYWYAFGLGG